MLCLDKLLRFAGAVVALGLILGLAAPARAVVVTWDYNSTGGTADGSGTWNAANTNWWNAASDAAWTSGGTAQFGVGSPAANPYTVTLSGSLSANGLIFQNEAYTITPSAGTLNLNGTAPFIAVNAGGGTIGSIVTGTAGLTKLGSGTLTFTGTNVYTGTTTINSGVVTYAGGAASSGGGALNVGNSAAGINSGTAVLNLNTTGTIAFGNPTTIGNPGFSGAINLTTGTFNDNPGGGYIAVGGNGSGVGGYGSLNIAGGTLNIIGTSGIRVGAQGMGSFTQSGGSLSSSRYFVVGFQTGGNGAATITGGTDTITTAFRTIIGNNGLGSVGALNIGTEAGGNGSFTTEVELSSSGSSTSTLNVNSGTLSLTNGNLSGTIGMALTNASSATGILNLNGGVVNGSVNNITLINNTLTAVNVLRGGANFNLAASSGTVSANLLQAAGNGVYPAGGSLAISANGGSGYIGAPLVSVAGGSGTGAMAVANITNGVVTGVSLTSPGQNYQAGDVLTFSFTGGGASTTANAYQYTLTANDVASNVGGLTKSGAGNLFLTGVNTFAGPTSVTAGTLSIGAAGSLATSGFNVSNGAINLFNSSQSINSLNGTSTAALGLNGTVLTVTGGGSFAGAILDNGNFGSLNFSGSQLTLSGPNVYSGGTTITGGTLQVGAGGTTGSLGTGGVTNNGLLVFNRSDTAAATALVVPGGIGGSGGVVLNGPGSVTLSGFNSYAGKTIVNAGTLIVNGTHSGGDNYTIAGGATLAGSGSIFGANTVAINAGGSIAPGSNVTTGAVGTLTVPALTVSSGTAYFDLSNNVVSGDDLVQVNGPLAFTGATSVVVNATNSLLANGNYALFDYSGALSYGSSATSLVLAPGSINARQTAHFDYGTTTPGVVSLDIVGGPPLNLTWVGGTHAGATNTWNQDSVSNTAWSGGNFFAAGDNVTFDATSANTTVAVSGAVSPSSVTVTGANNYTFTGSGSIGGGASLVVQGPGSLTIANSGGNGFMGGTFIQGGSIKLATNNGLPQAGTLTLGSAAANGTFDMAGNSQTVGGLATDPSAAAGRQLIGNSVASTTSTLTYSSTGTSNFVGNIQDGINGAGGQVALTVNAGQLTLGGSNTYTGPTSISSAGTLQLNSATAIYAGAATNNLVANGVLDMNGYNASVNALSGSGTITNSSFTPGSTLNFGGNNANSTFSGVIGGPSAFYSPNLNKLGGGITVLSGSNFAASVTVSQGTLQATTPAALGTASTLYAINAGSLFLNYATGVAPTWSNISGSGTLELATSTEVDWGTPALPSTFTGTVQVDQGRLDGSPASLGSAATVIISNSAQYLAVGAGITSVFSFPQNFYLNGLGWGESPAPGPGSLQNGALRVSNASATFTGNIILTGSSGIFTQNNHPSQMTIAGSITGPYPLSIYDGYTTYPITLSGSNTYTGPTTIVGGTVDLANSAAMLNTTVITDNGGITFDSAVTSQGQGFTLGGISGSGATALNDTAGASGVALSVGNNNQSTVYTGALSGSGSLTKIGTGSLVLGGSNTYLGTTTISAGTLQFGNGGNTGSPGAGTANIVNNGLLAINRSDSGGSALNIGGNISGSGSMAVLGTGVVTLSGSDSYGGTTAVNAGTLIVNGTHAGGGAYTVAGGATLAGSGTISGANAVSLLAGANIAPGNNAATGNAGKLTLPGLSLGGSGTAYFDLSNSTSSGNDLIQVNGALSLGNSTTVVVVPYNGSLTSGNYPLFDYTGGLSYASSANSLILAPGALTVRQTAYFDYSTTPGIVSLDVVGVALNLKWVGGTQGGFTNTWNQNVTANTVWSGGNYFASSDVATFDATSANTTVSISGAVSPSVVTVTGANAYTFTGPGQITGNGALNVTGSGSLTIANSGGNNYAGGTNIQSGAISLGENNGLPVAGALTLGSAGGSGFFNLAGYSQQVGSLATNAGAIAANQIIGNSAASTTSTLTYNNSSGPATFAGTILDHVGGSGGQTALTVAGGLLNLSGSNTYTGVTTVSTGTLQLGGATALYAGAAANNLAVGDTFDLAGFNAGVNGLTGSGTVINSSTTAATLTLGNNNASNAFAGILQGSTLNLNKVGNGTQVITGTNNAFSTTVSQGTLQIGNAQVNGTIGTSVYAINPGANLYLNYATAATPPWASFTGGGALELNSAQPVNATAYWGAAALTNSFTGTLQLDNGRVDGTPANLGGTTNFVINNGGQFLAFDGTTNLSSYVYPQNFSLNGFGWGEGGEQLGALRVSGMNATFSGNITLTGTTGIFEQPNHPSQITVSGNISGAYPLAINVGGNTGYTFTLSGSNNYTGPTTIGGVVDLANSAALLDTTLTPGAGTIKFDSLVTFQGQGFTFGGLSGAGAIDLDDTAANPVALTVGNNNSSNTYSGALSGAGSLTVIGSGTFTLAGTNTYTGGTTVANSALVVTNPSAIEDGTNLSVGDAGLLASLPAPVVPAPAVSSAVAPVPEPGTLALVAAGAAAAVLAARRRTRIATAGEQ